MQDTAAIHDYHAHIYYDPSTKAKAAQLRQWVEERFAGNMRMGSWHDEEVGPHVQAMYQIAFPPELFPTSGAVHHDEPDGADGAGASAIRAAARRPHAECDVDG